MISKEVVVPFKQLYSKFTSDALHVSKVLKQLYPDNKKDPGSQEQFRPKLVA